MSEDQHPSEKAAEPQEHQAGRSDRHADEPVIGHASNLQRKDADIAPNGFKDHPQQSDRRKWFGLITRSELLTAVGPFLTAVGLFLTVVGLLILSKQTTLLERQGHIMDKQTELLSDQVKLERPWVSAKVSALNPMILEGNRVGVQVGVTLKNHGRSPALNVLVSNMLLVHASGAEGFGVSEALKTCGPLKGSLGRTVFPEETQEIYPGTNLLTDIRSRGKSGDRILTVVTCIDYQFAFFSQERHQTAYVSLVARSGFSSITNAVVIAQEPSGKLRLLNVDAKPPMLITLRATTN